MKYKVLDVREYINEHKRHVCVVIAVSCETYERKRFEFYKGDESRGVGGDYALLIPGDFFTIEKEHGYDKIVLI